MQKEFSLSNGKVMINFTAKYCDSAETLLNSSGFKTVLDAYIKKIGKAETNVYKYLKNSLKDENDCSDSIIDTFKLLMVMKASEVRRLNTVYNYLLEDKDMFTAFIEGLYNFWRKLERYTIVQNEKLGNGLQNVSFISANNDFSTLILNVYRTVEENVSDEKPRIYRQLPAGEMQVLF